ncbi:MAG: hypothetical protein O3B01_09200 [Planctomycetota bacterium]|nr:hypothetical protein [Planctomycetota bacterium]MDA1138744.1 hypothetical protein [Planctomycetota bacterium]
MASVKDEAMKLIQKLPESASWEDLMYQLYVKKKMNEGVKAADEDRLISHEEVKARFVSNENTLD